MNVLDKTTETDFYLIMIRFLSLKMFAIHSYNQLNTSLAWFLWYNKPHGDLAVWPLPKIWTSGHSWPPVQWSRIKIIFAFWKHTSQSKFEKICLREKISMTVCKRKNENPLTLAEINM